MKRKQILAWGMAAALTVSMTPGTVAFAQENDTVQQEIPGDIKEDMEIPSVTDKTSAESEKITDDSEAEETSDSSTEVTDDSEQEGQTAEDQENLSVTSPKAVFDAKSVEEDADGEVEAYAEEAGLTIDAEHFPDEAFRTYISSSFDKDKDGVLSETEISGVTRISVDGKKSITDLTGIEYFPNLQGLFCYDSGITKLDVSKNPELRNLSCYSTGITSLNLANQAKLKTLYCNDTGISSLDVSACALLEQLGCYNTPISSLDVSACPKLLRLQCSNTGISSLDVSKNPKLMRLEIENAKLSTLNLEVNDDLQYAYCQGNPLYALTIGDKSKKLTLKVPENTTIDFKVPSASFDLTEKLPGIDPDKVTVVSGGTLSGSTLSGYQTGTPVVYTYDYGKAKTAASQTLQVTLNITVGEEGIDINEANFPDEVFREYVAKQFDKNGSGVLTEDEIKNITSVKVNNRKDITDLTGIEHFTAMTILNCENSAVTVLDVSNNSALLNLNCKNTPVSSLDLHANTKLKYLDCSQTPIESLDLSNNPALITLACDETKISSLDVSGNPQLTKITCSSTGITSLDLSNQTKIGTLKCSNTGISELDVSRFSNLQILECANTKISSLDLSKNTALSTLNVTNSNLSTLDISNTKLLYAYCDGNPLYALTVGDKSKTLNKLELPENTTIDLKVPSPAFDLEKTLPGIDISKVTIVSGGTLDGTMLTGYQEGVPVVYSYDYGSAKNATYETLQVTLNLTITSVPITVINQAPVINAEDRTLAVGDVFDPLENVTAVDKEDGEITLTAANVISNTVDTATAGIYEVTYKVTDSKGASAQKTISVVVNPKMEVLNQAPVITASDKVLTVGDTFNPLEGVTATDAEDGALTLTNDNVIVNTVDTTKEGTYEVTYKVTDSKGASTQKTISVVVNPKMEVLNQAPVITASDKVLTVGDTFNPLEGVTATDAEDGALTLTNDNVIVNTVDTTKEGTYKVTYRVTDSQGATVQKTIQVTVNAAAVVPNEAPVITAADKTLTVGDKFDALAGVTATDKEDGNITLTADNVIANTVDTTKAGTYIVTYKVTDSQGLSAEKTIQVTVNAKQASTVGTTSKTSGSTGTVTKNPVTADMAQPGMWMSILSASAAALAFLKGKKRKKTDNE